MTKTSIIRLLLALSLLLLCLPPALAAAQGTAEIPADSLPAGEGGPEIRRIAAESLQQLRADGEMDYHLASPEDNLWAMMRNWLFVQLMRLFGSGEALSALEIIVYTLCLIAIVYVVLRLLNVDLSGLLMSSRRKAVLREEAIAAEEDIHEIDFQSALAEALRNREFNKAVRLLYLSALKELSSREYIRWQPGKTNYQYQQELQKSQLQAPFQQLGYLFEWARYGGFTVSEQQFQQAEQFYGRLEQNLKQPA